MQATRLGCHRPPHVRQARLHNVTNLNCILCRASHASRPVRSDRVVAAKSNDGATVPSPAAADNTPAAAAAPDTTSLPAPAPAEAELAADPIPEEVFYEGPGSNAELALSLVLLPTLIYAPLSMASIGRRLWISFKFTNKRMVIVNTSPLFKRTIEVAYKNIKEIRTGPRAFGLWGDMVVFLRDGSRIELTGLEKYKEIAEYVNRQIYTL